MGHDETTRMGPTMPTWAIEGETPETMEEWEGEWPKRDAVPFVAVTERIDNNPAYFIYDGPRYTDPIGLRPAEVTEAMLRAGIVAWDAAEKGSGDFDDHMSAIYRAMAALAPVPLVSDAEIALTRERDALWNMLILCGEPECRDVKGYPQKLRALIEGVIVLRAELTDAAELLRRHRLRTVALEGELLAAHDKMAKAENTGNHDYHGPTEEVPHPTIEGRTERRAVPDVAHEQFHRAVGDVLAGKIMPKAREQMRDALGRAAPEAPTTASTSRPMPGKALGFPADPRRLGLV